MMRGAQETPPLTPQRRRRPPRDRAARERRRRVYRRRRLVAVVGGFALLVLMVWGLSSVFGGGGDSATADKDGPPQLPRGGRRIFPTYRVVSFYGAPQNKELGILGIGTPEQAAHKLEVQSRPYNDPKRKPGSKRPRNQPPPRKVLPAFELIATVVQSSPGDDGKYRERQSPAVINRYLRAARKAKAILILDVQPGQSDFMTEVKALEPWLKQPDVSLALDSEWSMKPGEVPGQVFGSTDARTVNQVAGYLSGIVRRYDLPQKLLLTHQFTPGMIANRDRIVPRPGVAIAFNIDGIGTPADKVPKYNELADKRANQRRSGIHNGFKLFYHEDTNLMAPKEVLSLRPQPEIIVYE